MPLHLSFLDFGVGNFEVFRVNDITIHLNLNLIDSEAPISNNPEIKWVSIACQ